MGYAVFETQTTNEGVTVAVPIVVKATRDEAEQEYHSKLSFAAVSNVDIHSVGLVNQEGKLLKSECYKHNQPDPGPVR